MSDATLIEKSIRISAERADHLSRLAHIKALSEDQLIEKALDVLFSLADLLESRSERQGWSFLSEDSLRRIWDNDKDAIYDNWRELYAPPAMRKPATRPRSLAPDKNTVPSAAIRLAGLVFVPHSWYTTAQNGGVHEQVRHDSGAG